VVTDNAMLSLKGSTILVIPASVVAGLVAYTAMAFGLLDIADRTDTGLIPTALAATLVLLIAWKANHQRSGVPPG
jgi:hypothetical protein